MVVIKLFGIQIILLFGHVLIIPISSNGSTRLSKYLNWINSGKKLGLNFYLNMWKLCEK